MRDWGDILATIAVALAILLVTGALIAGLVWSWQNAEDKRDCRRARGAVTETNNAEWHCVGATPEPK